MSNGMKLLIALKKYNHLYEQWNLIKQQQQKKIKIEFILFIILLVQC